MMGHDSWRDQRRRMKEQDRLANLADKERRRREKFDAKHRRLKDRFARRG